MDVVQKYYAELRCAIEGVDVDFAEEFRAFADSRLPNETWMWLDGKMRNREFPQELRKLMEDYYCILR